MENNKKGVFYFSKLSPKIKLELISLIDDFYSLEKRHTVVVLPFFGLLHTQGNESKPFLNCVDINILDLMKRQFKDIIVYPGENRYLDLYGLSLSSVKHLAKEQNILSRIINKTTNFNKLSNRHREVLCLYEKALADFDLMQQQYELPYKTAFDIHTPYELIAYIIKLDKEIKQEDSKNKICLVCPISYLNEHTSEVYGLLKKTIKTIGGTLYFAQNQSDRYLDTLAYRVLFEEQYEEKFIQSIQDFANVYSEDVLKVAKKKLQYSTIFKNIKNEKYGVNEDEIINNIKNIEVEKLY